MIIRSLLFLGALFAAFPLPAQTLIPWLAKNGLYGLATEDGQLVLEPTYKYPVLFPENASFVSAKKGEQNGTLFRSGHFIPLPNRTATAVVFTPNKTADTLHHLTLTQTNNKWIFIHSKTGKVLEFEHWKNYQTPGWFKAVSNYTEDRYEILIRANFHLGFHRVFKPGNRVNFIDTTLTEVFPRDYAAGLLLDRNRFLLADDNGKAGVGDNNGRILIPFAWDNIHITGSEDLFIVNNTTEFGQASPAPRAGLVHTSGRLVLDTIYRHISYMGNKLLRVDKGENQAGIIDYEGNIVLPMIYAEISRTFGRYFMVRKAGMGKYILVDRQGEESFPVPYNQLDPVFHTVNGQPYLQFSDGLRSGLADTTLHIMFNDTIGMLKPVGFMKNKKHIHFISSKNRYYSLDNQGVIDLTGRHIVPFVYNSIRRLDKLEEDLYLVRKDSLWGAYNMDGRVVLPVEFQEIYASSDSLVWARRPAEKLFYAYSPGGEKRPYPGNAYPAPGPNKLLYPKSPEFFNGNRMYGLSDGTIITAVEAEPYQYWAQYPSPEGGGFLLGESGTKVQAVNASLKPLIPEGYFVAPKLIVNKESLKVSALLNVCRGGTPAQPEACGLINARGEWVKAPKEGAWFHPLSGDMILEIPLKYRLSRDYLYPEPLSLHLPGGKKMAVHYIGDFHFHENNQNGMLIGIAEAGGREGRYAYFDRKGRQLIGFDIAKGPAGLKERSLVLLRKSNGSETYVILDARGEVLTELEGISDAEIRNDEPLRYFTAKERVSGLMGVIDSLGHTVLPFKFRDLKIYAPGRLLSCLDKNGATQLLDWKGNILYTANGKKDFWVVSPPNGCLLVAFKNEDLTVVIDQQDRFLHTLPYTLTNYARPDRLEEAHLAPFKSIADGGKTVWVDFVKAKAYKAE